MAMVVWHRRDLRLHDQAALYHAWIRDPQVIPVFIFDPAILARDDTSPGRVQFLLDCLKVLDQRYRERGSNLVIRTGDPVSVLAELVQESGATKVVWNQDVEPFAKERDQRVTAALGSQICESWQDMLLHAPHEILTQGSQPYCNGSRPGGCLPGQRFCPWWSSWRDSGSGSSLMGDPQAGAGQR